MSTRMIVLTMAGMLVLGVSAMAAEEKDPVAKSGTMTGTITEKGETWIRIKDAKGNSERFMPRWIGGAPRDGGGLDKDMLKQIAAVKAGDKVEVKWTFDERKRVVELKVLEAGNPPVEAKSGTLTGTVTEKGETWIRVKDAEGNSERFMPRWIGGAPKDGGGLDKDTLKQIAAVKAGDKVEVKWVFEERKRVVEFKVLAE